MKETAEAPVKYWGKYRAVVADNNDPFQAMRVRVVVPEVMGENVTNWAWPVLPFGGVEDLGVSSPPPIGARVWVEFVHGDPDNLIWIGYWSAVPGDTPEMPAVASGIRDNSTQRGNDVATAATGEEFTEGRSAATADYVNNRVFKTLSGHVIEINDVPNNERINISHRKGSYLEFRRDGSLIQKAEGRMQFIGQQMIVHANRDAYEIIDGTKKETYKNDRFTDIGSADLVNIQTNKETTIGGRETRQVGALYNVVAGGDILMAAGTNYGINAGSSVNIGAGAQLNMTVTENLNETIGNLSLSLTARTTGIIFGDHDIDILVGNINHETLLGNVKLDTELGNAQLSTSLGNAEMFTFAGNVSAYTLVGNASLTTLAGNVEATTLVGLAEFGTLVGTTTIMGFITSIGPAGIAPFMGGKGIIQGLMFNIHGHVAPLGPTSPPTIAGTSQPILQAIPGFDLTLSLFVGF